MRSPDPCGREEFDYTNTPKTPVNTPLYDFAPLHPIVFPFLYYVVMASFTRETRRSRGSSTPPRNETFRLAASFTPPLLPIPPPLPARSPPIFFPDLLSSFEPPLFPSSYGLVNRYDLGPCFGVERLPSLEVRGSFFFSFPPRCHRDQDGTCASISS